MYYTGLCVCVCVSVSVMQVSRKFKSTLYVKLYEYQHFLFV
jgi:hypothetical protein